MATHLTQSQRRLIIQDENLGTHHKKAVIDGKIKSSKPVVKKGGMGFGNRKALNDITNKSSLHPETSSRKKNLPKEEPNNITEEMFLHDHKKCIEAQLTAMSPSCFLDLVLPGHDSVPSVEFCESKPSKIDIDSLRCYPEPMELSMSEFSDLLVWDSPQSSPLHLDSPPSSPFARENEPVEFLLKEEGC
ncbi:protein PATRONUS 2-like [Cornus florida]|uniref:protein PATRONUS 2-like n=1 Tax=Cornus florida TaxID=4283 RepID=UPI00289C1BAB|nr:protein PATRONUS 2-like [Cornus florida]XP_059665376.1 protein PATRONUS 2-like [Cornus florida]